MGALQDPEVQASRATGREAPRPFLDRFWKGLWLPVISVVFLTVVVAGLISTDLSRARQDALNHWRVVLTNLLNNQIVVSTIWLGERRMDAELLAENPATVALLSGGRSA